VKERFSNWSDRHFGQQRSASKVGKNALKPIDDEWTSLFYQNYSMFSCGKPRAQMAEGSRSLHSYVMPTPESALLVIGHKGAIQNFTGAFAQMLRKKDPGECRGSGPIWTL